ncbi:hypothetical protein FS837_004799 [Tulasnella sp. UAMH 9824]|nr:hypothetical protein FS837_004799 [Tulasnella sp. UAMH 9824]
MLFKIVWAGSVVTKIPVWCDITTKLAMGVQVAMPAASMCITKHLECVASVRQTIQTASDKRRRQIFEFFFCAVFPCIIMALHYVVQGHRFDIAEDFGCMGTIYYSVPALLIIYIPPLVFSFASLVYASIAFVWFMKRRAQFAEHLQTNNTGLTTGRYFRLMALAVTEIVIGSSLGSYILGVTIQDSHFRDWDNWANVHSDFGRIAQIPRVLVPDFFWNRLLITWYIPVVGSVLFFIFFGFGQDAMTEYRRMLNWVRVTIFRRPLKASNESVLPTFSAPPRVARVQFDEESIEDEKWGGESRHSARTDDIPLEPLSPLSPPSSHEPEGLESHRAKAGTNV